MSDGYDYDDYDEYDAEDEEDLEALFVMGMLHDEEARSHKNSGRGCLTNVLIFVMIPVALIIIAIKA